MCRTLDRLCALVRGPSVPIQAEGALLRCLRGWVAESQDLGEVFRGVVPNPSGAYITPLGVVLSDPPPRTPGGEGADPAGPPLGPETEIKSKAAPPVKSEVKEEPPPPEESKPPAGPPAEASSAHPTVPSKSPIKTKSRSPVRRVHKSSRRTRSRSRSRRRDRDRRRERNKSPVSPLGVVEAIEGENEYDDDEGEEEESFTPDREPLPRRYPRSPSRPPPPRDHREVPDRRSPRRGNDRWQGPIRAYRREPPPGQGKHFGKNKGVSKRKRNKRRFNQQHYSNRSGRRGGRR